MSAEILEGTWEELSRHAERLSGKRLRVTVLPEPEPLPELPRDFHRTATPEEWIAAFRAWAYSHPHAGPPLSDEAISRESIYGEDH